MASGYKHTPEADLEKTDRLPILPGTLDDSDVADDAVPLDHTAVLPGTAFAAPQIVQPDFVRPSSIDLPSLAESVRSVEERIARQNAEFESLTRAYERVRDAEVASAARANALAVDLAAARTALDGEQSRSRDSERILSDRSSALEASRLRVEETLRESERFQSESRTLRDALAARDATIAQVLHSLGERDAQLSALQQEHAKIVPALEATAKSTSQLEVDLRAARADANALGAELEASRQSVTALTAQLKRSESEVNTTRYDLGAAKIQASTYLDVLRTREWRGGFDQNLFRDLDAQVGAAQAGQGAVALERDRLQGELAALEARLAAQLAAAETERTRLTGELTARDRTIAEAREQGSGDAQRVAELLEAADLKQAEQATQIAQLRAEQAEQIARLQSEAEAREQEMTVLVAHLQEARRPIQSIEADVRRLTEELAAKSAAHAEFDEENRKLRAALERTRGALEEREFLIRRLERSESNNANVLGRIQTSIERLGSVPLGSTAGPAVGAAAERSAELIRIDGEGPLTHVLSRRTRIGRAAGCELQIDSGSVSRHHALVLVGARDTIIEDLNSTNGVLVNGRKVSRHMLSDGDAVTIGESQFRYVAKPLNHATEPGATEPAP
jgi:septal ring factor EnvC (AmiA/AmiB activator)